MTQPQFNRSRLLLGDDTMTRLDEARVIVIGTGGVGSWCAEALVRTGLTHLTIVDSDTVCPSNINRQLMATTATVGQSKVDALRDHLLLINPDADITALRATFTAGNATDFALDTYDYIVDAIDSVADKAALIVHATRLQRPRLLSSMGAALKSDPTSIDVAEFWKVQGCPLAAALRRHFKRTQTFPARKFKCVYSPQLLTNKGADTWTDTDGAAPAGARRKGRPNGSLVHITAIFGMTLAGLIIQDLSH